MRLTLFAALLAAVGISATCTRAQQETESLRQGTWDLGAFAGGGNGLFGASYTRYFLAGGRVGRVLSQNHFSGWVRGNFEYAGDFMPAFVVFQQGRAVYGGNFTPIMLVWNFTAHRRIVPYILLSGGGLVTTDNVPRGPTSNFNFVGGGSFGIHALTRSGRALTFETRWVHISNANLGAYNPQLVSNFIFTVGYSWLK
jgi:lipid A 3-O-deacylase